MTLGVAAARSFPGTPRRHRPRAATPPRGSRPLPPLLLLPLCPRTQKSKAAGAAQRGVPATRAGRPGGVPATRAGRPLRAAKRASWLADSGQGSCRWAERRRASEALGRTQHGAPATRAGRPGGVPATRAGRPLRGANRASSLADCGQGPGCWAERRQASEALGRTQHGAPATRAGRPERVPATRPGRPRREAKQVV